MLLKILLIIILDKISMLWTFHLFVTREIFLLRFTKNSDRFILFSWPAVGMRFGAPMGTGYQPEIIFGYGWVPGTSQKLFLVTDEYWVPELGKGPGFSAPPEPGIPGPGRLPDWNSNPGRVPVFGNPGRKFPGRAARPVAEPCWVPAKVSGMPTPVHDLNFEQSFDKNLKVRRSKVLPPEIIWETYFAVKKTGSDTPLFHFRQSGCDDHVFFLVLTGAKIKFNINNKKLKFQKIWFLRKRKTKEFRDSSLSGHVSAGLTVKIGRIQNYSRRRADDR